MYIPLGLLIGILANIPLGPVNIFVISQTLRRDFLHGALAGATAGFLDAVFCLVSVLGMSQVAFSKVARYQVALKVLAAAILLGLARRIYLHSAESFETKPDRKAVAFSPRPLIAVFALYVSNPALYAFWIGTAGLVTSHGWVHDHGWVPIAFALAVGLGGATWYLVLTSYVSRHHHQFSPRTFQRIFIILAVVLCLFAAYTVLTIFVNIRL